PQSFVFVLLAEGNPRAIVRVAKHGESARRSLDANLVGASGFQLDLEPGTGRMIAQRAVVQDGFLAVGVRTLDDLRAGLTVNLPEIVGPGACWWRNDPFDRGPVALVDFAALELLGQLPRGATSFGKDHHARDGAVETMGDAQVDAARLLAGLGQIVLDA